MIKKSEFAWNMVGSVIYALFSAIILAFCTRLNGIEIAGMFSIAYATSCILNAVGEFGIRIFQSTDVKRKYTFSDYFSSRVIAIIIMIIATFAAVFIGGYTDTKLWICILLILYRVIDNLSESYQAEFQINERLDLAGKSMSFRNIISIIAFIVVDIITKNIILSCIFMVLANLITFLLYDVRLIKNFNIVKINFNVEKALKIVKECIPIAVAGILNVYVINAVKYAIDGVGDYTMQTYFNIIYMPTFVINLISLFIIKPFYKMFGDYFANGQYDKLSKIMWKIIGVLVLATAFVEIGCFILGVPFLNLFYGVDISVYKADLLILVLSGLFYAMDNLLFNLLSTIRKQKYIFATYILVSAMSLFVPKLLVEHYQMRGAAIASVIIMASICILLAVFLKIGIEERRKKKNV